MKTTSAALNPVSAATAARPASSTGAANFGGDVTADLGLVLRVAGCGVEHGEGLPRAGGTVEVYARDRRPGVPPGGRQVGVGSLDRQ